MGTLVERHVFISYASSDQTAAECLRDDLEADGLQCWMAPRDVPSGGDYAEAITTAIRTVRVFLLVLSEASHGSPHVRREVHLAAGRKMPILPVRIAQIEPDGALAFLLANTQWIDAFPRLEPCLTAIRDEVRRLLAEANIIVVRRQPTPFQRVLAGAASWVIVLGLVGLIVAWIQRQWLNFVPLWNVPAAVVQQAPALSLLIPVPIVLALAGQYLAHRRLERVASLDALFAVGGSRGASVRLAAAAVLALGLSVLIFRVPPAVTVALEPGDVSTFESGFKPALSCRRGRYIVQQDSHFVVRTRVGTLNPPGRYSLRLEVGPWATQDGLEFCDVRVSDEFGVTHLRPARDDGARTGYVEIEGSHERFTGARTLVFNATHYLGVQPSDQARVRVTVGRADGLKATADGHIPPSIFRGE